jgi:hypothetical protein
MDNGDPTYDITAESTDVGTLSRAKAAQFAAKWKDVRSEKSYDQQFWHDFVQIVLGIPDLKEANIEFQKTVVSSKKGTQNYIDVFWQDVFLAEHKSAGRSLDVAEEQARDYLVSLAPSMRPPVVIVTDFARFRIVDVLRDKKVEFPLEDLPNHLHRIEAIVGKDALTATHIQVEADQKAARLMADLYVQLEKYGYEGHEASVFLVRILFCLFADDTRMWKLDIFEKLVKDTNPLGTDLGPRLSALFEVLNTPRDARRGPQDPLLEEFPYVNGGIFQERLATINFNTAMRNALLNACAYDWSGINPTIFGELFQDIKSKDARRRNGEHYTTEANIEKAIRPLLLDDISRSLEQAWDNEGKLKALQKELGTYQIFDPACGCGNFLITTYKRLREFELEIIVRLKQLQGTSGQTSLLDVADDLFVRPEQLHGIEFVEWSAQIAKVAIYLTDHQENLRLETVLGVAANRFPLTSGSNIVRGNALELDWAEVCPMSPKTLIVGNPPYVGANKLEPEQRADQSRVWNSVPGCLTVDYVANWFLIASQWAHKAGVRFSFVSTNSITQGDQPATLWKALEPYQVKIDFAHRTFAWENDAAGNAGVHCVIIGMSSQSLKRRKQLWHYETPKSTPTSVVPSNINAYLLDYPSVLIPASKQAPNGLPPLLTGNEPRDGGFLSSISLAEAEKIRMSDPHAAKYLRPLVGGAEVLGKVGDRFCLWLVDLDPLDMKNSPELSRRVALVKVDRQKAAGTKSAKAKTIDTPTLFARIAQPSKPFIAVPAVSSEHRRYIPMAFYNPDTIINNQVFFIESDDLALFMVLQSRPFTEWVKIVSSRLESRYRINAGSVYNTFPYPDLTEAAKANLRSIGEDVLRIRDKYAHISLGDLYNSDLMPVELLKLHQVCDKEVLKAYGLTPDATEPQVQIRLLDTYQTRKQAGEREIHSDETI